MLPLHVEKTQNYKRLWGKPVNYNGILDRRGTAHLWYTLFWQRVRELNFPLALYRASDKWHRLFCQRGQNRQTKTISNSELYDKNKKSLKAHNAKFSRAPKARRVEGRSPGTNWNFLLYSYSGLSRNSLKKTMFLEKLFITCRL